MSGRRSQRGHVVSFVMTIVMLATAAILWGWSRIADDDRARVQSLQKAQLTWFARSAVRLAGPGETKTTLGGREAIVKVTSAPAPKPGEQRLMSVATAAGWGVATVVVGTTAGKVTTWDETYETAP